MTLANAAPQVSIRLIAAFALLCVQACATGPELSYANKKKTAKSVPVERASIFPAKEDKTPNLFVGVAISGGGSRAATFGAAVLEELGRLGFLEHTKVISTVSGGSIAGAYYALNVDRLSSSSDAWQDFHEAMRTDIRGPALRRYLLPHNFLQTLFSDYDRSDIFASELDERIFKRATFRDLGEWQPGRPHLLINATNITEAFASVQFSQSGFDNLHSDLATYRIGSAVAASAAFPGLLNTVTLRDFEFDDPRYQHLMDGGPSDNLGVGALRLSAQQFFRTMVEREHGQYAGFRSTGVSNERVGTNFKCLFIVIDAFVPSATNQFTRLSDLRRSITERLLVDSSLFHAFDSLLQHRRVEAFARLKDPRLFSSEIAPELYLQSYGTGKDGLLDNPTCWYWHIALDHLVVNGGEVLMRPVHPDYEFWGGAGPVPDTSFPTAVMLDAHSPSIPGIRIEHVSGAMGKIKAGSPRERALISVHQLVTRIETDLRLAGPPGCSAVHLQKAIRATARVVTTEALAREGWCSWLRHNVAGGARFHKCDAVTELVDLSDLADRIDNRGTKVNCHLN